MSRTTVAKVKFQSQHFMSELIAVYGRAGMLKLKLMQGLTFYFLIQKGRCMKNLCKLLWGLFFSFVLVFAGEEKMQEFVPKSILKKESKYLSVEQLSVEQIKLIEKFIEQRAKLHKAVTCDYANNLNLADEYAATEYIEIPKVIKQKYRAGAALQAQLLRETQDQENKRCCLCSQRADLEDIIECTYSCYCCCIPNFCRQYPVNYFNQRIAMLAEQDIATLNKKIEALQPQQIRGRE